MVAAKGHTAPRQRPSSSLTSLPSFSRICTSWDETSLEAVLKLLGEKKRVEKAYSSVQMNCASSSYAKAISDKCHPSAMATAHPLAAQTQMAKRWLWTSTCQFATSVQWHPVSDEDRLPMAHAASYLWLLADRVWLFQSLAKARCF